MIHYLKLSNSMKSPLHNAKNRKPKYWASACGTVITGWSIPALLFDCSNGNLPG